MNTTNNIHPVRPSDDGLSSTLDFIQKLAADRYFGNVQLSFQSGNIVNIRQEQSIKPADLPSLVANSKGNCDAKNHK